MSTIKIRGARTHNLKNINLDLPRNKLVVITGLSGSGKSSLAFDTLYAEGQRRYVESLSAYARQFLAIMEKPDLDLIEGLSPAISIEQKATSHNPRSTVGTITEIYDYLRLLFARVGEPKCPKHGIILKAQTVSQMVDWALELPEATKIMLLAPVVSERKGEYSKLFEDLQSEGFVRVRVDGEIYDLEEPPKLNQRQTHTIEVVVDRLKVNQELKQRLAESFETALKHSDGVAKIVVASGEKFSSKDQEKVFSAKFACPKCGYSLTELEPRLFSFNNPMGACPKCDGLGVKQTFDPEKVIHDPNLTLGQGAVRGWDRRNTYYFSLLTSLAKHFSFNLDVPFKKLPKKIQNIILYGSEEIINFSYTLADGRHFEREHPFEGVIPNMERRFRETDSFAVREEMAKYFSHIVCPECQGSRLKPAAQFVFIAERNISEITALSIKNALSFFDSLTLSGAREKIASKILEEVRSRLKFLINVGLDYLSLNRSADTLSGGEAQRIRLASQLGSGLVGVMYILDEPTIGLHQRDNQRLLNSLLHLRDLGNSVIVVEHDAETILTADHVIDIGPYAGVHGGEIVFSGSVKELLENNHEKSLTGKYLSGKISIATPKNRIPFNNEQVLKIIGAKQNNLKNISVEFPLGLMTVVTGVSGSGKSSLVNDILYPVAVKKLNHASASVPNSFEKIEGLELLDKVVAIDQSPIGRTPRSNPATYTGLFNHIRDLFCQTVEARTRGYQPGRFSFNVRGGRCEACQGDGLIKVEMHFLPDIYVTCDVCQGKRYNRETLEVTYKGKNISEVLEMTVEEALTFFAPIPSIRHKLETLAEVGLSYLRLGQSATTLSGGEAQRIKLAKELSRRDTGKTLYLLDEPTTGLHFHDVKQLLNVLTKLRDRGNTIIIIEHNLDVVKTCDWIIDLGPEGGEAGGEVVDFGTPEQISNNRQSYTGVFLKKAL
jgi:excinuclease ABC subunit A